MRENVFRKASVVLLLNKLIQDEYCFYCCDYLNFNNFSILSKCNSKFERQVEEAFFIKNLNPSLNKQLYNSGSSFLLNIY